LFLFIRVAILEVEAVAADISFSKNVHLHYYSYRLAMHCTGTAVGQHFTRLSNSVIAALPSPQRATIEV